MSRIPGDDDGTAERRPLAIVSALVMKATRDPSAVDVQLQALVTPQSLNRWNLDHVAKALEGTGIDTKVGELGSGWREVRMVPTRTNHPMPAADSLRRPRYSFYLRFLEDHGDWRVHVLARPGLTAASLG